MRFCLMVEGQEGVSWHDWLRLAEACERLGFEGLFRSDHYLSTIDPAGRGSLEAWATLAALAARTERVRLGTLVSPPSFRHPSVLAKLVSTVDHVSAGRVELGLGAGWYELEHRRSGLELPPPAARYELLEEQLRVLDALLQGERCSFEGRHYSIEDWQMLPQSVQRPRPPLILGGKGRPKMARLIALYADEYNCDHGSPEVCSERYARVRAAAEAAGRDATTLRTSLVTGCLVGSSERELRRRAERVTAWLRRGSDVTAFIDSVADRWVIGTPDQAAEKLERFAEAGVERIMLQHLLHRDIEMLELLADDVFPRIGAGATASRH